jgi:hypothetical protein
MRSSGYIRTIIAAQMLAQIGAFALPALLPDYIERWSLQDRGRLAGRHLLRRLCRDGAGSRRLDRPDPGAPGLSVRHRPDGDLAFRLCPVC